MSAIPYYAVNTSLRTAHCPGKQRYSIDTRRLTSRVVVPLLTTPLSEHGKLFALHFGVKSVRPSIRETEGMMDLFGVHT
ncbi:hypothetical protein EMCRGX_G015168 [Ephydatia muelleri]|eukprot:Em0005g890a